MGERVETRNERLDSGFTVRAHLDQLMSEVESSLGEVFQAVRTGKRLTKLEREVLSRRLSGVQGRVETLAIWLRAGAKV